VLARESRSCGHVGIVNSGKAGAGSVRRAKVKASFGGCQLGTAPQDTSKQVVSEHQGDRHRRGGPDALQWAEFRSGGDLEQMGDKVLVDDDGQPPKLRNMMGRAVGWPASACGWR